MGCSGRVKIDDIRPEQKWEFISLNDFKSTSCINPFAYAYLWINLLISVAVYGVDTFTAVNLLAFNKWSSEVKPAIPLNVSKWIFSGCIIASWVNVGFEHVRAARTIKRGAVAENYLDSLAVRLQSVRLGKGRGWRRFLVFAELTKSKKGAEYVALFTYFSFQSWIRIIFCQGPRQVINALTLWAVLQAQLDPKATDVGSTLLGFFKNIGTLADREHQQAVIYSGMLFTLVIWVFGALSLLLAMLFYILFLWHYIPNADGGLSGYCERKINQRLSKIVSKKVNKAIEEEERKRIRADAKAIKKGEKPSGRQATLPTLFDPKDGGDKLPPMPMLHRNDTTATLPQYSSRPGTPSSQPSISEFATFELDSLEKRPAPGRNFTNTSTTSFGSNAPLTGNASDMGYGRSNPPAPSLPPLDTHGFPAPLRRTETSNSTNSNWSRGPPGPRMPSAMGDRGYTASPVSYTDTQSPPSAGPRGPYNPNDPYGRPDMNRSNTPGGPAPSMGRRTPFDPEQGMRSNSPGPRHPYTQGSAPYAGSSSGGYGSERSQSPNALHDYYGASTPTSSAPGRSPTNGGYQAYDPSMRSTSTAPTPTVNPQQPYRNVTDPGPRNLPPGQDYFNSQNAPSMPRPGTGQSNRSVTGPVPNRLDQLRNPGGPPRLASPAPYNGGGTQSPSFGGPGSPASQGGYRR